MPLPRVVWAVFPAPSRVPAAAGILSVAAGAAKRCRHGPTKKVSPRTSKKCRHRSTKWHADAYRCPHRDARDAGAACMRVGPAIFNRLGIPRGNGAVCCCHCNSYRGSWRAGPWTSHPFWTTSPRHRPRTMIARPGNFPPAAAGADAMHGSGLVTPTTGYGLPAFPDPMHTPPPHPRIGRSGHAPMSGGDQSILPLLSSMLYGC
jgi:hypothetical protein